MSDVQNRAAWLLGIAALGLLTMTARLYWVSIEQSAAWRNRGESQIRREMPLYGPRGNIYDRKGRALATSEPAFAAVLVNQDPAAVEQILPGLAQLLSGGDSQKARFIAENVRRRVRENKAAGRQYEPITIRYLSRTVVSTLMERRQEFPGVVVVTESIRNYPNHSLAGTLVGYVAPIRSEQLGQKGFEDYYGDEIVGQDGLELYFESVLHGKPGIRTVIVDPFGRPTGETKEIPAGSGSSLVLALDLDLQQVAEKALAVQMDWIRKQNDKEASPVRGAMVVQDVRTGAILAMASIPTFDPNLFVSGISDSQWQQLINDPAKPMQNWTLAGYPPGSTYKMAVGLAGLETGAVGLYEQIDCPPRYWRYHQPKNWTAYSQGFADVARALAVSCDPYFYEVGHRVGIDKLAAFLEQFGFGSLQGIDLPGEQPGINPTQQSYGDRWTAGQVLSVAIGQGDVLASPLQLAGYTAMIANGGVRYRPYLVSEIRSPESASEWKASPHELGRLQVRPEHLARVQQGMRLTVTSEEGTAHRGFRNFPIAVAAKTGSAETGHVWSNALTVAYAPYDKPEIAVAVVVEGGGHGSWVVPAARAVMAKYFDVIEIHDPGVPLKQD